MGTLCSALATSSLGTVSVQSAPNHYQCTIQMYIYMHSVVLKRQSGCMGRTDWTHHLPALSPNHSTLGIATNLWARVQIVLHAFIICSTACTWQAQPYSDWTTPLNTNCGLSLANFAESPESLQYLNQDHTLQCTTSSAPPHFFSSSSLLQQTVNICQPPFFCSTLFRRITWKSTVFANLLL